MVNEPCASDLMRIYNLDIAPTALFELRRVDLQGEFTKSADVIYKQGEMCADRSLLLEVFSIKLLVR